MPLIRYFVFVGGALLALLFVADRYMDSPVNAAAGVGPDVSIARIHSAQTWPEKIVFDTSVRQIPLSRTVSDVPPSAPVATAAPATQDGTRQAFAMVTQPARGAEAGRAGRSEQARRGAAPSAPAVALGGARPADVLQRALLGGMVSRTP